MSTRRLFVQSHEAIELVSFDGQSAVKITMARATDGALHAFVQTQPFTQVWLDAAPTEQRCILHPPLFVPHDDQEKQA
jgi:hypothetical protein